MKAHRGPAAARFQVPDSRSRNPKRETGNRPKGQVSSMDGLAAVAGLMVTLTVSFVLFTFAYERIAAALSEREAGAKAFYALEELMSSGNPAGWQLANYTDNYGLEREPSVLDASKLANLSALDYSAVKERIGLSKYNFSLDIYDFYDQTPLYSFGYSNNSTSVIGMQHVAVLDNSLVTVSFRVAK